MIKEANDSYIRTLITEVQDYSRPTGQIPSPPVTTTPRLGTGDEHIASERLERPGIPPWFEPIEHSDDRELIDEGREEELPAIDGYCEVPEPDSAEEKKIDQEGIDALAYYAPFHFYRRRHWGIYIKDFGIVYLASRLLGRNNLSSADNWALRCAYWFLYHHEYFHFQTEIAASSYEILTGDEGAYEKFFNDSRGLWLEESMANARAYLSMSRHEDVEITFPRIELFKGFASNWMKSQPPGYRDYVTWCRGSQGMQRGRSAIIERIHYTSSNSSVATLGSGKPTSVSVNVSAARSIIDSSIVRPFEKAEYTRIPIVRVRDSGLPSLEDSHLFPKASGIQVLVYTREHPPVHIHVLLGEERCVRLAWPSLTPLEGDRGLSAKEMKNVNSYLKAYHDKIWHKLRTTFADPSLPRAVLK